MVPIIAASLVALGATALAIYFDRETEEERCLHDELLQRNEKLRRKFSSVKEADARQRALKNKQLALDIKENLATYCIRFQERMQGPAEEFRTLAQSLTSDLADTSISPYRRNALRLLQGRVEDTRNRVAAFSHYCEWYLGRLEHLVRTQRYEALVAMTEPSSRLPDGWFYEGKVGLACVAELNGSYNEFGQGLKLLAERQGDSYSDAKQRALLLQYPDQEAVPVQLIGSKKNKRHFKACIVRGALHVDHILEQMPCMAFVEGIRNVPAYGDGYLVRCFPSFCTVDKQQCMASGIRAFLPRGQTSFPGKRYLPGEQLDVYLHYYDLLLSGANLTVTQHRDSLEIAGTSSAPIFLHADGTVHDLYPLLQEDEDAVWQLRSYAENETGRYISLQLGAWQIDCEVCADESQLRVTAVTRTGFDSLQLDALPYPVRLIGQQFKDSVFCDALQFQEFLQFCRQQCLFAADEQERKTAGKFFERWNAVTEYLLAEEGYQTFTLAPAAEHENREWECQCNEDLETILQRLTEQSANPRRLYIEELYVSKSGAQRWLQVGELSGVPEALGEGRYLLSHKEILRPDPAYGYQLITPVQLRLRYPNGGELANLGRQKHALQAFMNGRMENRSFKQILMMPHRYAPQPSPFWIQRVSEGLQWQDPDWKHPECAIAAKRVVEGALTESNVYLIQGPPGTGKTTCIVEMLYQIFAAAPQTRVLVVSQQNTAVDNALERFLKRYPDFRDNILRISNDPAKVQPSLQPYLTDELLTRYLAGRQQAYSGASLESPAKAAWIGNWIESIYRQNSNGEPVFDAELTELLCSDYNLVGATCVGLASRRFGMDRLVFDICIIDEGGRSTVPELLIPLLRSRKAIIIGDHFQLPPSIAGRLFEEDAKQALPFLKETFLKTSFFEQLYENLPPECRGRLREQYRMAEPIGDLVADLFYTHEGARGLFNGRTHDRTGFLDPDNCLRWVNVGNGRQETEPGGASLFNMTEAAAILNFLQVSALWLASRKESDPKSFKKKSVAIITPYGAQKRKLRKMLANTASNIDEITSVMEIEIDTVDSFQGSEADIVLYSTVRTQGNIRFLLDRQRLNVACSRARENLVFFGDAAFLQKQEARSKKFLFSTIIQRCNSGDSRHKTKEKVVG